MESPDTDDPSIAVAIRPLVLTSGRPLILPIVVKSFFREINDDSRLEKIR